MFPWESMEQFSLLPSKLASEQNTLFCCHRVSCYARHSIGPFKTEQNPLNPSQLQFQRWNKCKALDRPPRWYLLLPRTGQQSLLRFGEDPKAVGKRWPRPFDISGNVHRKILQKRQIQILHHRFDIPSTLRSVQDLGEAVLWTAILVWKSHSKIRIRSHHRKHTEISRCCCLFDERSSARIRCNGPSNSRLQDCRSTDNDLFPSSRYRRIYSQRRHIILKWINVHRFLILREDRRRNVMLNKLS